MAISNINVHQLKEWIDNDEVCLVDVRETIEHHAFRIDNSAHVPLGTISGDKVPETDKKIVIYCLKGVRGQKACEKVTAAIDGIDVFNLEGGIDAWRSAGLPIKSTDKKHFSLERQVQIAIGTFVVLAVMASIAINPVFVWVAGFFGAALLFAGLTGNCPLSLLIAKMPWNKTT